MIIYIFSYSFTLFDRGIFDVTKALPCCWSEPDMWSHKNFKVFSIQTKIVYVWTRNTTTGACNFLYDHDVGEGEGNYRQQVWTGAEPRMSELGKWVGVAKRITLFSAGMNFHIHSALSYHHSRMIKLHLCWINWGTNIHANFGPLFFRLSSHRKKQKFE